MDLFPLCLLLSRHIQPDMSDLQYLTCSGGRWCGLGSLDVQ